MASSVRSRFSISPREAIVDSLKVNNRRLEIIKSDPASPTFLVWFTISCYFPIVAACIGPVANSLSIASAVENWRSDGAMHIVDKHEAQYFTIADPPFILAMNILAVVIGCLSNIVLVLHFMGKLGYLKSQILNITGWSISGILLLVGLVLCRQKYLTETMHLSIGFWFGCYTCGLYLLCGLVLSIHFVGNRLGIYPATFNLLPNERTIIIFTLLMSLWLTWGAGCFGKLLKISWGNALYFVTVSILTVGFGDFYPDTTGSRLAIILFAISGVIMMGIIVYMTQSIIKTSSGPVFYYHRVQVRRKLLLAKLKKGEINMTKQECFDEMMRIRQVSKFRQHLYSFFLTTGIFLSFSLLGAVVFHFVEGWSYFNCLYFCFLCLLTIGYGSDFVPSTGASRSFFVVWGLCAVPLMGAIISAMQDIICDFAKSVEKIRVLNPGGNQILTGSNGISPRFSRSQLRHWASRSTYSDLTPTSTNDNLDAITTDSDFIDGDPLVNQQLYDDHYIEDDIYYDQRYLKLKKLQFLLHDLRKLERIVYTNEKYELSFEQWETLYTLNHRSHRYRPPTGNKVKENFFWLSDRSPLQFPIHQSRYAFEILLGQSEDAIDDVIDDLEMSSIGSSSVSHSSKSFPSRQAPSDETGSNPSNSTNENDNISEDGSDEEDPSFPLKVRFTSSPPELSLRNTRNTEVTRGTDEWQN